MRPLLRLRPAPRPRSPPGRGNVRLLPPARSPARRPPLPPVPGLPRASQALVPAVSGRFDVAARSFPPDAGASVPGHRCSCATSLAHRGLHDGGQRVPHPACPPDIVSSDHAAPERYAEGVRGPSLRRPALVYLQAEQVAQEPFVGGGKRNGVAEAGQGADARRR